MDFKYSCFLSYRHGDKTMATFAGQIVDALGDELSMLLDDYAALPKRYPQGIGGQGAREFQFLRALDEEHPPLPEIQTPDEGIARKIKTHCDLFKQDADWCGECSEFKLLDTKAARPQLAAFIRKLTDGAPYEPELERS